MAGTWDRNRKAVHKFLSFPLKLMNQAAAHGIEAHKICIRHAQEMNGNNFSNEGIWINFDSPESCTFHLAKYEYARL